MNKRYVLILLATMLLGFGACKKSKVDPESEIPADEIPPPTTDRTELSLDSIFLYAKQIYYWNTNLPTYKVFNPRQYKSGSTNLKKYESDLFGIATYSTNKYDVYQFGGVYQNEPKYSYIIDRANKNPSASINDRSSVDTDGNGNDIGIRSGYYVYSNGNYLFYVSAVYGNSPAALAGITRGDLITKVNGVPYGTNYDLEINVLDAALKGTVVVLEGVKANGNTFNVTLTKTVYKSSHIYAAKILTAGAKKIGYLAYARFGALSTPSSKNPFDTELNSIFTDFANAGVTDLVVDLRYNGGGYVYVAEYLTNLIAPSTARGVMYKEYYNQTLQTGAAKILANQPYLDAAGKPVTYQGRNATLFDLDYTVSGNTYSFSKKGNLNNVANIVFLVAKNTASASELLINNLKPQVNVKLVGETTYGKPIGFFPITIENKYDVWMSSFITKNSAGQGGDYFSGMVPDVQLASDLSSAVINGATKNNVMFDFGNPNDAYLKAGLNILAPNVVVNGQLSDGGGATKSVNALSQPATTLHESGGQTKEFKGMIENRFKLKD